MSSENVIIICIAMQAESRGLFEHMIIKNNFTNIKIIYTGIGKVKAAYSLTKAIYNLRHKGFTVSYVINLGSAGGESIPKGTVVICNKFIQQDMDQQVLGLPIGVNLDESYDPVANIDPYADKYSLVIEHKEIKLPLIENVYCGTQDSFDTKIGSPIKQLEKSVSEMEAYSLALVCKEENIDFIALKYITDEIGEKQDDQFNQNLNNAPYKLSCALDILLKTLGSSSC
jgi:adenosylhomocysteine nucleosidase